MIYYCHDHAVAFKHRHNGNFSYVRRFITQQQPIDTGVKSNLDTMLTMHILEFRDDERNLDLMSYGIFPKKKITLHVFLDFTTCVTIVRD